MSRLNPLLRPKPAAIWSYGLAAVSVAAALIISRSPVLHLQDAPVSLFLCAVILSAWFGGLGPGVLATALSTLAFFYCFLPPIYSLDAKPEQIPRLVVFILSALFVGSLSVAQRNATESLRGARDQLGEKVQELQSANEALQVESHERKSAEESLRRSEGYLAEAQRLSHTDSWASIPAKGEIKYFSEECYRVMGFDPHDGQPRYEEFFQRVHPDDQAKLREAVENAGRDKTELELDYRFIRPSGVIRDIHVVGHPVLSPSSDLVEFVGTVMDVTERKRADEALRRSEGYLAEAQRLSQTGSWASTIGEIRYLSEECYRVLGFDPNGGQPQYETFFQRIHPDDQAKFREAVETAERDRAEFELDYRG